MKIALWRVLDRLDWLEPLASAPHPPSLARGAPHLNPIRPRVVRLPCICSIRLFSFSLFPFSDSPFLSLLLTYFVTSTPTLIETSHSLRKRSLLPITFFWTLSLPSNLFSRAQLSVKIYSSLKQFASSTPLNRRIRTFCCYTVVLTPLNSYSWRH